MIDWHRVAEIALTCIASVGGIGVIIIGVVKFCGDMIAERLSMKYQLQLDKEKERYISELSKKEYVSKTRFDAEFSIYRELTSTFSKMVTDITILIPAGYVEVPADEADRAKLDQEHYINANNSVVAAQNALYANSAFIPKPFCDMYEEVLKLARLQLFAYTRRFNVLYMAKDKDSFSLDDYKRTADLQNRWEEHVGSIRKYLATLDVIS